MAENAPVKAVIHVSGVVQGVGFRPFVARLAREHGLTGSVRNVAGQVDIEAFGPTETILRFLADLQANKPNASWISRLEKRLEPLPPNAQPPESFSIAESGNECGSLAMPTPDLAVCEDCLREMDTVGDPRYRNPFISCTNCGPRFSILHDLPYDRVNTSMAAFPLCPLCGREYGEPTSRRYHAQTVCCNACGPTLCYHGRGGQSEGEAALAGAISALRAEHIIAIKGIGGYHLACSPFSGKALSALRLLKGREAKPFAVMFESLSSLEEHCAVSPEEAALLTSPARPIVLLRRKASPISGLVFSASPDLGAFLPYTPLQHLLLRETGPLVMTSANLFSLPIIKDDEEMLAFWATREALAGVLSHDRPILRRLDDSVAAVIAGKPSLLRRARGYTPLPLPLAESKETLLACGAQEKSAICLAQNGYAYLSAELGSLDTVELESVYQQTTLDMEALLGISPSLAVYDPHPGYASTQYAAAQGLPLLAVQHHHAHIASVMTEHSLTNPVIGVAFDGTGFGMDGTIWGGEFLIASPTGFTRAAHLKAIPMLGGDSSIMEGWKSAACLLLNAGIQPTGDDRLPLLQAALAHGVNAHPSSSMGRVFDGISALLSICLESKYSGQCAMELEYAATRYLQSGGTCDAPAFPFDLLDETDGMVIDLAPCIRAIYALYGQGESPDALAWRFHVTLCEMIVAVCGRISQQTGLHDVALSGGVFANRLLVEKAVPLLHEAGFRVYRNHQVPAGDGGIALGQAYVGLWTKKEEEPCASRFPES